MNQDEKLAQTRQEVEATTFALKALLDQQAEWGSGEFRKGFEAALRAACEAVGAQIPDVLKDATLFPCPVPTLFSTYLPEADLDSRLEAALRERGRWSDVAFEDRGVRGIVLPTSRLANGLRSDPSALIAAIWEKLPSDAVVADVNGSLLNNCYLANGEPKWEHYFIVLSAEWPVPASPVLEMIYPFGQH